jgi:hypothetical protein
MSHSYLDAVEHLRAMTADLPGVDAARLREADALIAHSRAQLDAAYSVLASAYDAVPDKDDETEDSFYGIFQYLNHIDGLAAQDRENQAETEAERLKQSRLEPSGFTETSSALHECAGHIVAKAKAYFAGAPVKAQLWAYRWDDCEILSCDLLSEDAANAIPVTITAAGRQMLDVPDEPEVFDMTEALHLAGMITQALDATVTVGRTGNEVNETVLPAPLPAGNTNGRINLWRESAFNSSSPEA